jgi:hypothetical protein
MVKKYLKKLFKKLMKPFVFIASILFAIGYFIYLIFKIENQYLKLAVICGGFFILGAFMIASKNRRRKLKY